MVKSYLENTQDVEKIIEKLQSFCQYVQEDVRDICLDLVKTQVPVIIEKITQGLDAEKICKIIGMCD